MSNNENIISFSSGVESLKIPTLEDIIQQLDEWRANKKHAQEKIPEIIWDQIILLSTKIPEHRLRPALGLTNSQWRRRIEERPSEQVTSVMAENKNSPSMDFCEVKTAPQQLYTPAKIPATNTLVVEFCRSDGRIMKIHTTTDSFVDLIKAFFAGE
jgi:hypothetical protein